MKIKVDKITGQNEITTKDGRKLTKTQFITQDKQVLDTFSKDIVEGQEYEGEITENQWGKTFSKAKSGFKPFGGRSDEERLEIIRQSSLERALQHFYYSGNTKFTKEDVIALAEYFATFVKNGLGKDTLNKVIKNEDDRIIDRANEEIDGPPF